MECFLYTSHERFQGCAALTYAPETPDRRSSWPFVRDKGATRRDLRANAVIKEGPDQAQSKIAPCLELGQLLVHQQPAPQKR